MPNLSKRVMGSLKSLAKKKGKKSKDDEKDDGGALAVTIGGEYHRRASGGAGSGALVHSNEAPMVPSPRPKTKTPVPKLTLGRKGKVGPGGARPTSPVLAAGLAPSEPTADLAADLTHGLVEADAVAQRQREEAALLSIFESLRSAAAPRPVTPHAKGLPSASRAVSLSFLRAVRRV